jgi:nucleoside phosphorylase
MRGRPWRCCRLLLALALLVGKPAARAAEPPPARFGDGACALASGPCSEPVLAVFSAFPAELAPLLARATVRETLVIGDRVLRIGTLSGVPVVLGLLGIGYANAADTTRLVLDRFDVGGFVVSGVAGSPRRIGDVSVPESWTGPDGVPYPTDAAMLDIARQTTTSGLMLEHCTPVPPQPPGPTVCLDFVPGVFVGGAGETSDPYGGRKLACVPGGNDVFGCDVESAALARGVTAGAIVYESVDQETAAVGRETAARGVPYIAFRAVSDGAGDPLGLPGFPAQFFAYYDLAARNAAAATAAFLTHYADAKGRRVREGGTPVARASCDWAHRVTATCRRRPPDSLRTWVTRACRALASTPPDDTAAARAWTRAARVAARSGVRRRVGRACAGDLAEALRERAEQPTPRPSLAGHEGS